MFFLVNFLNYFFNLFETQRPQPFGLNFFSILTKLHYFLYWPIKQHRQSSLGQQLPDFPVIVVHNQWFHVFDSAVLDKIVQIKRRSSLYYVDTIIFQFLYSQFHKLVTVYLLLEHIKALLEFNGFTLMHIGQNCEILIQLGDISTYEVVGLVLS